MESKDISLQHGENEQDTSISSDSEKGARQQIVYPMRDEDYVVTFKTWVVVTILASAYGVSFIEFIGLIYTQKAYKL
jgi:hypothetical protein